MEVKEIKRKLKEKKKKIDEKLEGGDEEMGNNSGGKGVEEEKE